MRLPTHREQYDVIGFYKVLVLAFSSYTTAGARRRYKRVSHIIHLILHIGFHGHDLWPRTVAKYVHLPFSLSGLCTFHHNFYCILLCTDQLMGKDLERNKTAIAMQLCGKHISTTIVTVGNSVLYLVHVKWL
jgi:hypothetical protein